MFKDVLMVAMGSFLGGGLRYLISVLTSKVYSHSFPLGTFLVNVLGCFLIGLLYGYAEKHTEMSAGLLLLLTTGFCGGFTTFSTFINESATLGKSQMLLSILYMALSLLIGMVLLFFGKSLIR